jgi:hypothetical protein
MEITTSILMDSYDLNIHTMEKYLRLLRSYVILSFEKEFSRLLLKPTVCCMRWHPQKKSLKLIEDKVDHIPKSKLAIHFFKQIYVKQVAALF